MKYSCNRIAKYYLITITRFLVNHLGNNIVLNGQRLSLIIDLDRKLKGDSKYFPAFNIFLMLDSKSFFKMCRRWGTFCNQDEVCNLDR